MTCPICGHHTMGSERRSGRGRYNYKVGILAALLTNGIGFVAGFADFLNEKEYVFCESCGYWQFERFHPRRFVKYDPKNNVIRSCFHGNPLKAVEVNFKRIAYEKNLPLNIRYADYDDGQLGQPCLVVEHRSRPDDYLKYLIATDGMEYYDVYHFGKIRTVENARELHQNAVEAIRNSL